MKYYYLHIKDEKMCKTLLEHYNVGRFKPKGIYPCEDGTVKWYLKSIFPKRVNKIINRLLMRIVWKASRSN